MASLIVLVAAALFFGVVLCAIIALVVVAVIGSRKSPRVVQHRTAPCRSCGGMMALTDTKCAGCGHPVA